MTTIRQSTDYAIVAVPSGDHFIVRQGARGGQSWEAYGPIVTGEAAEFGADTTTDEVDDLLDNQPSHDIAVDGDWLWDEHEAGRVQTIA